MSDRPRGGRGGGRRGGGGGNRGRGGGARRGRGRGGGGGGAGRGDVADRMEEDGAMKEEIEDEFDSVVDTRRMGDKGEGGYDKDVDLNDDEEEEEERATRRMTKKFEWEEEADEEFNDAGERIEPFNLVNERKDGFFDEAGNYVWKKEVGQLDPWLASLDNEQDLEAQIGSAANAKRQKDDTDAGEAEPAPLDVYNTRALMLRILQPGETVLKALKRLSPKREPPGKKQGPAGAGKPTDERSAENKATFDQLTELADLLLQCGVVDIYEKTYEELKEDQEADDEDDGAAAAGAAGAGAAKGRKRPASMMEGVVLKQDAIWEYKGPDGEVHGPFTTAQITQWRSQGFLIGPTAVLMREVKAGGGSGNGESQGPPAKAQKTSEEFNANALEDFDEDDEDEEGLKQDSGKVQQAPVAATSTLGDGGGQWVSSDTLFEAAM